MDKEHKEWNDAYDRVLDKVKARMLDLSKDLKLKKRTDAEFKKKFKI